MKLRLISAVAVFSVGMMLCCATASAQRYGDEYRDTSAFGRMQQKLGRGLSNVFTGVVEVPTGPGLGVELDEVALRRCVDRYAREGAYDFYTGGPVPRY